MNFMLCHYSTFKYIYLNYFQLKLKKYTLKILETDINLRKYLKPNLNKPKLNKSNIKKKI